MAVWYMPVIMAERLGEQTGAVVKQRVNRAPWLASLSILGVRMSGVP